jgi:SAM-dependent methyltransferase
MHLTRRIRRLGDELTGRTRRRELQDLNARLDEVAEELRRLSAGRDVDAVRRLSELEEAEAAYRARPPRDDRISDHIKQYVERAGPKEGRVLEVGARNAERSKLFDESRYTYETMDLDPRHGDVVGDITGCPDIPSESFDVIITVDVFEHLREPWAAASEITRLLRPGGLSYTSTLFSWRYHPCPVDYWRFSPACLEYLFRDLRTIECDFDVTERRRDIRKKSRDDPMPLDVFGGWRENVRVHHVGVKETLT